MEIARIIHPNEALAFIGDNSHSRWAAINFPDSSTETGERWKLFITSHSDDSWYQVFGSHPPFLRLDWLIRAMYENSLPVSALPFSVTTITAIVGGEIP